MEPGESDLEAARREILEELGVEVTAVGPVQLSVQDTGSEFAIEFLSVEIAGEPRCLEHQAVAWMEERDLLALPLAPSVRRYVELRLNGRPSEGT